MGKYNEIYLRPAMMNMVEEDGKIWFALLNGNGICEVDKVTKKARICKVFEDEPLEKEVLYCHVKKVDHYLVFSPGVSEKIAIYDLNRDYLSYVPIKKLDRHYKQSQDGAKFWNIIRYHSDVYLMGYSYPAIIKINIESMKVTYITDWVEEVENYIEDGDSSGYFGDGYVIIGDSVLIPLGCMSAVVELNLNACRTKIKKISTSMKGIGGLSSIDNENVWLVGKGSGTNKVACWNIKMDRTKEYKVPDMEEDIFDPFYAPVCMQKKVFLMPISAPFIYEIDIDSNRIKKSNILERKFGNRTGALWTWWKIMAPAIEENWIRYITCDDLGWHEYNVATGESQEYYIHFEENITNIEKCLDSIYSKWETEYRVFLERIMPLDYFINKDIELEDLNYRKNDFWGVGKEVYDRLFRYT